MAEVNNITTQSDTVVAVTGAKKNDLNKLRMDLIPVSAINSLADILTFGAQKYDDRNWEKGFPFSRVYSALQRHLVAWFSGEDNDPESGRNHLEHALCNIAFLNEFRTTHPELDDRPNKQYKLRGRFVDLVPPLGEKNDNQTTT